MNGREWTFEQRAVIEHNLSKSDAELAELVSRYGRPRTADAVARWRADNGFAKTRGAPVGHTRQPKSQDDQRQGRIDGLSRAYQLSREAAAGWPPMRGSQEERDKKFADAVLAEGVRLGLARAA